MRAVRESGIAEVPLMEFRNSSVLRWIGGGSRWLIRACGKLARWHWCNHVRTGVPGTSLKKWRSCGLSMPFLQDRTQADADIMGSAKLVQQ
jgi:hypothetical protein